MADDHDCNPGRTVSVIGSMRYSNPRIVNLAYGFVFLVRFLSFYVFQIFSRLVYIHTICM